jgi:hypothetical protein
LASAEARWIAFRGARLNDSEIDCALATVDDVTSRNLSPGKFRSFRPTSTPSALPIVLDDPAHFVPRQDRGVRDELPGLDSFERLPGTRRPLRLLSLDMEDEDVRVNLEPIPKIDWVANPF